MLLNLVTNGALAYMDPASGSLILQIVLGGIAGAAVALKMFWGRITSFFGGSADSSRQGAESAESE
ncbi:MAG TPA: hypothetical protein VLV83_18445 [Acidobacteriota bacterium]|nr:hypothetical protein [Acidobacteriota bacterium]